MIVKVVHPERFQSTLFSAEYGPVTMGAWYFDEPPSQRCYGDIVQNGEGENVRTHCIGVNDAEPADAQGQWKIRYAWWQEPDQITQVVTSGEIYLLSSRGDTVDKVR